MEILQGKHFSITDPKDVKTVIYQIISTKKEYGKNSPKFIVERLDYMEELTRRINKENFFCGQSF